MEMFYIVTMAIALIILILILTVMGIMLSNKNKVVFPPSKNACPDYWTEVIKEGKNVCQIDNRNIGTFNVSTSKDPGYDVSTRTINFKDPAWANKGDGTALCAMQKWCNANRISWDGVSNYNGCK